MSVLVIGASGNLGRHVVRALLETDAEVTAFVRESEQGTAMADVLEHPRVQIAYGDLTRPDTVLQAARGSESIFVLTPHMLSQVELQKTAVDVAAEVGARIVKVSSWGPAMRADTPVPGARRHWSTQEYIIGRGVPYTFLQPNHFMQVLLTLYSSHVSRTGILPSPPGEGGISMVDARDVAEVAARVLTEKGHDGRTYVLSGRTMPSYVDIAKMLSEVTGRPVRAETDISEGGFYKFMASQGRANWDAEHAWAIYQLYRQGIGELFTDDVERLTGHPPRTIADFLDETRGEFAAVSDG